MSESPEDILAGYVAVLGMPGVRPAVEVRNNLGSKWLGQTTFRTRKGATEIYVEVQAAILDDERTLRRVLAHEGIHCVELATMTEEDLALARRGRLYAPAHGPRFWELAQVINEAEGDSEFVTEQSDRGYVTAENEKPFLVLIEEVKPGGRLGWSWAVKRTPAISAILARKIAEGAKLIETTDGELTSGVKVRKRQIGMSIPKQGSDLETKLRELWESSR